MCWCVLTAALGGLCAGAVQGWTAPALPYLLQEAMSGHNVTSVVAITEEQASWIGAIAALGGLVGALPAGHLADILGRRRVLLLLSAPFVAAWLLVIAFPTMVSIPTVTRPSPSHPVSISTVTHPSPSPAW
ncbi:hypothetical protein PR048_031118 [Dryococelus australis]|uniref:Major facilitator superfamily (MFS) profile domain-containing protein n=1 Tax=Dryococelus australis TaxID=614101 RepID=A0ABQ9G5H8_9NEOP|nr:hypothetical protein PR048_031118 [Dryococelus australis]